MKFSVIVPAYNEEKYLPRSLGAICHAAEQLGEPVEILVGDNLSTDRTAEVAREFGAKVVPVDIKCIGAVRNRTVAASSGRFLVFNDADNRMSENALCEIDKVLSSGEYVGGGLVRARYERRSVGLSLTQFFINANLRLRGVSMFMFFATAEAFREIGGFNEGLYANEDMDFALRLKRLGKQKGLKFCNLRTAELVMSARKFDEYGDWGILRHPVIFIKAYLNDREAAHEFWYRPRR